MKKVYLAIALVFLSFGVVGCNVSDEAKFLECLARDRTPNPCH